MLKILGAFVVLGLLVFFLIPVVASMDWARELIVRRLGDAFDAPVSLEEHRLGWFSGVELRKLRVGNPRTFAKQGDLLRLDKASFDMSFLSFLFGGKLVVLAKAEGLEIRLHQLGDGRTNVDGIIDPEIRWHVDKRARHYPSTRPVPVRSLKDADGAAARLADLDLDLSLTNALLEVTDANLGVLESLHNLNAGIRKKAGDLDIVCKLDVELHHATDPSGRVSAQADIDLGRSRPSTFQFEVTGLDLARYRPLLDWASANPFEELEGVLAGKVGATMQPDGSTSTTGKMVLSRPRLKTLGEQSVDLRGEAFVLEPKASFHLGETGPEALALDLGGFRIDLGFLQAKGMDRSEAASLAGSTEALGLRFTLDLGGLTRIGGIVPRELRGSHGTVNGRLLVESLDLDSRRLPIDFEGTCQDGRVRGNVVRLLRYAVPLLAGLDVDKELDFESDIHTTIQLSGPLLRRDNESELQWLNHWRGTGKLELTNGAFTPARQFGELLAFAGERGRLNFQEIRTEFLIQEGAVETGLLKMNRKAETYGFRGKVLMDGRIDYRIALQDALAGHRDGERIRRYLGDKALEAKLEGSLENPRLTMPSLDKVLEAATEKRIDDALKKRLDRLFRGDKKKRNP